MCRQKIFFKFMLIQSNSFVFYFSPLSCYKFGGQIDNESEAELRRCENNKSAS